MDVTLRTWWVNPGAEILRPSFYLFKKHPYMEVALIRISRFALLTVLAVSCSRAD